MEYSAETNKKNKVSMNAIIVKEKKNVCTMLAFP